MTATFFEYLGWVSLSPNLKESFNKALLDAEQHRHGTVEIEHLLFALIDDPEGAIALTQKGVDRDELRDELADHLDAIPAGAKLDLAAVQPARALKKLMAQASDEADNQHDDHIDGGDVIGALADFEMIGKRDFLRNKSNSSNAPQSHKRSTARKAGRGSPAPLQNGDDPMDNTPPQQTDEQLNFDVDPIKASIKAIMARRRDAEEILLECEWYHLFKSLNMIDEVLEGEEQTQRAKLLSRAEKELAERPRCRKAFLYVRHLDQELVRLKGIVDIDWAGDFTPDEAVSELARLRTLPQDTDGGNAAATRTEKTPPSIIAPHPIDVNAQESEVLALEQKLARLDQLAGFDDNHFEELESNLQYHDTHSKKRERVIGVLEHYLHSEMEMADARDQRIDKLEQELRDSKNLSDSQIDKTSHLELELAAFKEHAGNRELLISDLEAKLKAEKQSASAHEEQLAKLQSTLNTEKERAQAHDTHVEELQRTYESEKKRASDHEKQVLTLETDLKSRLEQLRSREEQIKNLQENLNTKTSEMATREEYVKKLEADLSSHEDKNDQHLQEIHAVSDKHQNEVQELVSNIEDKTAEGRQQQQEINALRAQLNGMESRLQDQETAYSVEKIALAGTIEQLRLEIEESESLIEIIQAPGEPYTVSADVSDGEEALVKIIHRRTIPVPAKPNK